MRTSPRKKVVLRWAVVLGWMVMIFSLSHESADGSSARSDGIVELLRAIGLGGSADVLSAIVRKSAHVVAYAVLGGLVVWAMAARARVSRRLIAWSVVVACSYAVSDELHQAWVPGRSAEVRDVLIDTAGAAVGAPLAGWIFTRHYKSARVGKYTNRPENSASHDTI